MPIRLLKLRAWLKTRTNMFLRAARAPVLTVIVAPEPKPHAFDAWVCEHCDPETLFDDLDKAAILRMRQASASIDAPDPYDPTPAYRHAGLL